MRCSRSSAGFGPEATISKNSETISNPATAAPIIMSCLFLLSLNSYAREGPHFSHPRDAAETYFMTGTLSCSFDLGDEDTISRNNETISNPATPAPITISSLISPFPSWMQPTR